MEIIVQAVQAAALVIIAFGAIIVIVDFVRK